MCSLVGSWISSWFWVQRFYWFSQLKRESWSFDQVGISCLSNSQWISLLSIIHLQILLRALRLDARRDSLLKATATFLNNRLRLGVKEIGREKIVLKTSHHQNYERKKWMRGGWSFEVWISFRGSYFQNKVGGGATKGSYQLEGLGLKYGCSWSGGVVILANSYGHILQRRRAFYWRGRSRSTLMDPMKP